MRAGNLPPAPSPPRFGDITYPCEDGPHRSRPPPKPISVRVQGGAKAWCAVCAWVGMGIGAAGASLSQNARLCNAECRAFAGSSAASVDRSRCPGARGAGHVVCRCVPADISAKRGDACLAVQHGPRRVRRSDPRVLRATRYGPLRIDLVPASRLDCPALARWARGENSQLSRRKESAGHLWP